MLLKTAFAKKKKAVPLFVVVVALCAPSGERAVKLPLF